MTDEIRCPECGKKFAEMMVDGLLIVTCPRCHKRQRFDKRKSPAVSCSQTAVR